MKERDNRTVDLVLDDGGPFVIWQDADTEERRRGLFVNAAVCDNPECGCREIFLTAVSIDERYTDIRNDGKTLKYTFIPQASEPKTPPPLRYLSAKLDVDSGRIDYNPDALPEERDTELLARLREELKAPYLERLRKRWRLVKGNNRNVWREMDWSWWEPGLMISWRDVNPDDYNLLCQSDGTVYWADDLYCITPGCSCKEVGLVIFRIDGERPTELGTISITLPACRLSKVLSEKGDERLLRQLWSTMRKGLPISTILKDRMKRIKPIGQEIVRLSARKESIKGQSRRKIGRNDPCPCGSGKKYKKCCLGKRS